MLDVGGQDSTEAFEDVGHSDEAREILEGLLVGKLKRQVRFHLLPSSLCFALPRISPGTLLSPQNPILRPDFYFHFPSTAIRILTPPKGWRPQAQELRAARRLADGASTGVGLYAIILIGGALAFGAWKYLQAQSEAQQ
jgi:hypothetical protein